MRNGLSNLDKNKMVIFRLTRLCFLTARAKRSFGTGEAEIVAYWIWNYSVFGLMWLVFSWFSFQCSYLNVLKTWREHWSSVFLWSVWLKHAKGTVLFSSSYSNFWTNNSGTNTYVMLVFQALQCTRVSWIS